MNIHHDLPLDLGQTSTSTGQHPPRRDLRTRPSGASGSARVRWTVIQRVRREIALGVYDTPDKWDVVVARLLPLVRGAP